jgi:Reverse transcriptase (RNA-dependent DNA polymerase)
LFGISLLLLTALYGLAPSGRLWAEEVFSWLISVGFVPLQSQPAILVLRCPRGFIKLALYIDDTMYHSNKDSLRREFERNVKQRFDCELLGQAHWFLQARITQHADFRITIDQSGYVLSTVARFLPNASIDNIPATERRRFRSPLPTGFTFLRADLSTSREMIEALESEFGFHYPAVIGCLIWLLNTGSRIQFAVRKLAKAMAAPGKVHFVAVRHLLHHLRCDPDYGVTFYPDIATSPLASLILQPLDLPLTSLLHVFTDSSFQDCFDTGRSTCGYIVLMQGGVVDCSSVIPEPVALSSAEAEYNGCALACRATAFCRMLALELRGLSPDLPVLIPIFIDNAAAQAMSLSPRDTDRTRHIARRWHYVRAQVAFRVVELIWVPTNYCIADGHTKALDGNAVTFLLLRSTTEDPVTR